MEKKVRVRYAPSPTGYLHIGGARSALFNYLYAKKFDGDFVFRIEDTDIERNIEGAEESQLHDLIWLGIIPDESTEKPNPKYAPYRQTEKLDLYRKYAEELVEKGYAYYCYETPEEIEQMKEEQLSNGVKSFKYDRRALNYAEEDLTRFKNEGRKPSIRLKMEKNVDLSFVDLVRGKVNFNSDDFGDFVIIKSNGIPTYNFAVVIDDHIMDITHVLRGEEHLSNTPKQLQVYKYFNWEAPAFGHMTIIINPNGKKLSKRDHDILQFMSEYRKLGYLPEAIFNFLFLLGFNPDIKIDGTDKEKEIYSKEEAIAAFDPKKLSSSPSMFDNKKLLWTNAQYIKAMDNEKYFAFIEPFMKEVNFKREYSKEELDNISLMFKEEISTGHEISELLNSIINPSYEFNDEEKELLNLESSKVALQKFKEKIENTDDLSQESVKLIFKSIQNETGIKGKNLYMPIRLTLTGSEHGIEMFNIINILGKEETLSRIK